MGALYDLVAMTVSSAPGTSSTISLGSAATINSVTYLSFTGAGTPTSTTVSYSILDVGASELGTATFLSSGVLTSRTPTKSTNANAAIAASSAAIILCATRAEDIISTDIANSFTATQKSQARTNIAAILRGQLWGLTLSTAGSSTTFGIAAGEAADSTAADLMVLASAYTKTTASWAVGTGNGALDTGTTGGAASTWYSVFLIKRPDTGVVDVLFSLSATAPTLPTNYTLFRRIGSMKTDGSKNWTAFTQLGDEFLWSVPVNDSTGTYTTTATTVTLTVPTGVQIDALLAGLAQNAGQNYVLITSPDQTDSAVSSILSNISMVAGINSNYALVIRTNTSGQVRIRASASSTTVFVNTFGWIDTRGRLV